MTNLKLKDFIKTIIFILFISFIIWQRLFREFATKIINEYIFNVYIVSWSLLIFLYLICIAILKILKYDFSFNNPTGFFSLLYIIVVEYFIRSYEPLLYYISTKIDLKRLAELPVSYLVVYARYPRVLVIIFTRLSGAFISTLFAIEVLYFHKIEYFYKFLPILLIPLIFNAYFFIVVEVADVQLDYLGKHVTCEDDGDKLQFALASKSPDIPDALSLEVMQKCAKWLFDQYYIFINIEQYCIELKDAKDFYFPWFLLYNSIIYFISWLYIFISINA